MSKNLFIRGTKRKCGSCQTLFYDLEKYPIICPNCGASVSLLTNISKRGRPPKNSSVNNKIENDLNDGTVEENFSVEKDESNQSELEKNNKIKMNDSGEEDASDGLEIDESDILDNDVVLNDEEISDESDEVENIIEIERDEETQN